MKHILACCLWRVETFQCFSYTSCQQHRFSLRLLWITESMQIQSLSERFLFVFHLREKPSQVLRFHFPLRHCYPGAVCPEAGTQRNIHALPRCRNMFWFAGMLLTWQQQEQRWLYIKVSVYLNILSTTLPPHPLAESWAEMQGKEINSNYAN